MSLDVRLQRLEALIGYDANVQREYQERMQFVVKLLVWNQCANLTPEQRSACQNARVRCEEALRDPKFQKYRLPHRAAVTDEEKEQLRRLVADSLRETYHADSNNLGRNAKMQTLWARYAPEASFPWDQGIDASQSEA